MQRPLAVKERIAATINLIIICVMAAIAVAGVLWVFGNGPLGIGLSIAALALVAVVLLPSRKP